MGVFKRRRFLYGILRYKRGDGDITCLRYGNNFDLDIAHARLLRNLQTAWQISYAPHDAPISSYMGIEKIERLQLEFQRLYGEGSLHINIDSTVRFYDRVLYPPLLGRAFFPNQLCSYHVFQGGFPGIVIALLAISFGILSPEFIRVSLSSLQGLSCTPNGIWPGRWSWFQSFRYRLPIFRYELGLRDVDDCDGSSWLSPGLFLSTVGCNGSSVAHFPLIHSAGSLFSVATTFIEPSFLLCIRVCA